MESGVAFAKLDLDGDDRFQRLRAELGVTSFGLNLMRLRPMPVVMISSLTERGAETTFKALELGAVDFVSKPKVDVAGTQVGRDGGAQAHDGDRARLDCEPAGGCNA